MVNVRFLTAVKLPPTRAAKLVVAATSALPISTKTATEVATADTKPKSTCRTQQLVPSMRARHDMLGKGSISQWVIHIYFSDVAYAGVVTSTNGSTVHMTSMQHVVLLHGLKFKGL